MNRRGAVRTVATRVPVGGAARTLTSAVRVVRSRAAMAVTALWWRLPPLVRRVSSRAAKPVVALWRLPPPLPLTVRLALSHVAVLAVTLMAVNIAADALAGFDDYGELRRRFSSLESAVVELLARGIQEKVGIELVWPALTVGLVTALVLSLGFSRFLLRPLRQVSTATHRLTEGHYDDVLDVPREPGLAALVEDVNRLAAALADMERRRARLVSEIAHEMRTPLTILSGQIEGMADGIFAPDDLMFASLADDLNRLRRLADDLSNLSRAEEGAFVLHHTPTDVTALAVSTAERLRPQFDDGGITLGTIPGPPVMALLDAGRITQVLVNLLGNALAACDPGGRVAVSVNATHDPEPQVEIRVQDTGIGIAAHDLTRIFTRFERVQHPERPAPAGGSGIGLTIARGIVRAHGGNITAASRGPGLGATFIVRLPAGRAA
ncbi:two-component sensor histidine kinase [Streptosporangium pseudovulgare]|uniref:histidine kinase n=1 Tax=Streptosporangium pseudovulgare TaxID=35765 RepID=A0ABQ2RE81_9ACTN|nr:two-component sensor histidine kinase [Streptosporangium pseudovulgare]